MKKLVLVDYYGNCDALGNSVGHSPKVLGEYCALVEEVYQVEAILPQCIIDAIDCNKFTKLQRLPYQIIEEGNRGIWKRILDKIKLFANISQVLAENDGDIIWFYRTDFFYFYLCSCIQNIKK